MKTFITLFLALMAFSCQDKEDTSKEGPNTTNIENVEGSMPDTSNSSTINAPDTTRRDSL